MTARAKDLFETSIDQVRRGQVRNALTTLLDALAVDPLHQPSLAAAGNICRVLGSLGDAERFEALTGAEVTADHLFEMGWHLVDQGRPDVAEAYLQRALAAVHAPAEVAAVRRELAFAQLQQRQFATCLTTLAPLFRLDELAEAERLDIDLLAAEAALYAGRVPVCRSFLEAAEQRIPDEVQLERIDALHALLGRAARWEHEIARIGLREWHHIQHAGVLLKTAGGYFEDGSKGGRFELLELRADMVAFLLQRMAHLLERLELRPELVVPASDLSEPLARALARHFVADVETDLAARGDRPTLLIAASASELAPYAGGLANHRPGLAVAVLSTDWDRNAPVCPDIIGVFARRAFLPWEERYQVDPASGESRPVNAAQRPADVLGDELHALMLQLPDDGGESRESFEAFYLPLADELVLGNPDRYPVRRQFTHLSPAWQPTGPESMRAGSDGTDGSDDT